MSHRFFRLASINILSNLMVPLASLIDTAFLGHLQEIRHLAGVVLANVLFNYLYWTFGFLRMGTTGMTAQAVGRTDRPAEILIAYRNGLIALCLGLGLLLLQVPLREVGFTLLQATADVKASGQSFYNALIWGAPATLLNFVIIGWFLGREQSDRVLVLTALNSGINIVLDYYFILHLGWESRGAGAATAVSQYLTLLVGLGFVLPELCVQSAPMTVQQILDPVALRAVLLLNRDILIRTFALISTFALFINLSSLLGTSILATNAILQQIIALAAYFIDGLAFAAESLVGIYVAQHDRLKVTGLLQLACTTSLAIGLTFAIGFTTVGDPVFRLLTHDQVVLTHLPTFAPWLIPILGFGAIAYLLDGYFLGLTAGTVLRRSTLFASLVGFVPPAIVASVTHSNHGLWLALTGFMALRAITLGLEVKPTLNKIGQSLTYSGR